MFRKEAECSLTDAEIEKKAEELLDQMTLKEKIWLLSGNWDFFATYIKYESYFPAPTNGVPRLNIAPIVFTDGPRGVAMGRATAFPVSMARGATFDRSLEKRVGDAIGKEVRAQGATLYGGVCVNLLRHPAWGRAQETYGEDPFHVGEMGKTLAEAVQRHNVIACVKHFAVNNIENSRFKVNVEADDRTMHEVYLPHFKKIVDAGAASVMGAYNRFRGEQACESRTLLTGILRDEWGFEGFTLSDFVFGVRDGKKAIEAGMDVEMPMPIEYQQTLLEKVIDGEVAESTIDQAVRRVLRTQLVFENTPDPVIYHKEMVASAEHIALAREVAEKSMVLVKNQGNILPFSKDVKRVLVLGRLANTENTGDHGSSKVNAPFVETPLEGLKRFLGPKVEVIHRDETKLAEARELAKTVDCVIIIAGYDYQDEGERLSPDSGDIDSLALFSTAYQNLGKKKTAAVIRFIEKNLMPALQRLSPKEGKGGGGDRKSLSLKPDQVNLIKEMGSLNPKTVVCLVAGSMVMTDEWAGKVPVILYSWYAGMKGGTALARLLFGEVNPCGRLPFTTPQTVEDLPYFSSTDREITYDMYHGYALLDKKEKQAAYPFGYGLSYTTFNYGNASVEKQGNSLEVKVEVTNTGQRGGEEVVQVYIGKENSAVERARKRLAGFEKVAIGAGETVHVTINIPLDDLRYYDPQEKKWVLEPGSYLVMVGPNSDEKQLLKLEVEISSPILQPA